MKRRVLVLGLILALTASAAACDSDSGDSGGGIVSLSPTATEMLFAIGAGDEVVAVDDQSNYPPESAEKKTDLSGFTPNAEAIAELDPDLVVLSNDTDGIVAALEKLDIEVLLQPAAETFDDAYEQIEQLGEETGHEEEAADLVVEMKADIEEIVATVPAQDEAPTYYHELDNTFFTVTSKTFIGQVYALAGLENIADPADEAGGGYPQLSVEFIVEADPDLVFLADTKCCDQSAETVAARPGWADLTAVKEGGVVELDDDIASRWGPRVVDFLRTVVDAVKKLEPAA